jgi:flagellar hook-associated protein FlgK
MNFNDLNKKIETIIDLNIQLSAMDYSNPSYDEFEDNIHDLQDEINDKFGDDFDLILDELYEKFNITDETMFLADYIAGKYEAIEANKFGKQFLADVETAAIVEIDNPKLAGKKVNTAIYIKPNPLSIIMSISGLERVMWTAPAK